MTPSMISRPTPHPLSSRSTEVDHSSGMVTGCRRISFDCATTGGRINQRRRDLHLSETQRRGVGVQHARRFLDWPCEAVCSRFVIACSIQAQVPHRPGGDPSTSLRPVGHCVTWESFARRWHVWQRLSSPEGGFRTKASSLPRTIMVRCLLLSKACRKRLRTTDTSHPRHVNLVILSSMPVGTRHFTAE